MNRSASTSQRQDHKRSKSAVLMSIVTPSRPPQSSTSRSPTKSRADDPHLPGQAFSEIRPGRFPPSAFAQPVLGEINQNRCSQSASPKKSRDGGAKAMVPKSKDPGKPPLFSLLSSPRKRQPTAPSPADQENMTPPGSGRSELHTPIWAQFASQPLDDPFLAPRRGDPMLLNTSTKDFAPLRKTQGDHQRVSKPISAPRPDSRVGNAIAMLNAKSGQKESCNNSQRHDLDAAFEAVLDKRNIPETMRHNMRMLDASIKEEFVRNAELDTNEMETSEAEPVEATKSSLWGTLSRGRAKSTTDRGAGDQPASPSKRSRSRSRTFNLGKGERSPTKRARSNSRPRSIMLLKNLSSSSLHSIGHDGTAESKDRPDTARDLDEPRDVLRRPDEFVKYLREQHILQEIEVGRLHKLRLLLRNETVSWVDTFILKDGMKELLRLLDRLRQIEWREEHDDLLLHEILLCLKGLCTTERALNKLAEESSTLFPNLLNMLFDDERRGPSEFNTRGVVVNLLYAHLASTSLERSEERAKSIFPYLSDPETPEEAQPVSFIFQMKQRRPYRRWCKEITNVTKEVFWIFLHHQNVISADVSALGETYKERHFPKSRPPVPAASWVGGVEWEACNYLTSHLDLMNGLIASLSSVQSRNQFREDLRASGFENLMGNTLRTCKEKFYGSIHDALRTWILAAAEDGWAVADIQMGPQKEENASPSKSPKKGENKKPPQLQLPKLDLGAERNGKEDDGWL